MLEVPTPPPPRPIRLRFVIADLLGDREGEAVLTILSKALLL